LGVTRLFLAGVDDPARPVLHHVERALRGAEAVHDLTHSLEAVVDLRRSAVVPVDVDRVRVQKIGDVGRNELEPVALVVLQEISSHEPELRADALARELLVQVPVHLRVEILVHRRAAVRLVAQGDPTELVDSGLVDEVHELVYELRDQAPVALEHVLSERLKGHVDRPAVGDGGLREVGTPPKRRQQVVIPESVGLEEEPSHLRPERRELRRHGLHPVLGDADVAAPLGEQVLVVLRAEPVEASQQQLVRLEDQRRHGQRPLGKLVADSSRPAFAGLAR
jgi:hypothetical protein